jgi:hypothetical protein
LLVILVAGLVVSLTMLNRTSRISVAPVVHHKIEKSVSESTQDIASEAAEENDSGGRTAIAGTPIP